MTYQWAMVLPMSNQAHNSYLCRHPAVSMRRDGHNAVLFDADRGREKVVNSTGTAVWEAMDGVSDAARIGGTLAEQFDADAVSQIALDVQDFGEELVREGYATATDEPLSEPLPKEAYADIRDAPGSFDLALTGACNLKCSYCFYADEMAGRNDLPAEEWLRFFVELKSLGTRSLTLSGGEVFVRPDLWELIDAIVDARMRFSLLSNGTLITEETLEALTLPTRRRRLDSIQVSIDGASPEVHDRSRGEGTFVRAIHGLRLLKEAGFPVTARMTINRYNVDDIGNVAALLLDDIGLSSFGTNDAMPMGAGCSNQARITLTPAQQLQAMRTLEQVERKYNGRVTATAGPLAKIKSYREMERARLTGEKSTRWRMGNLSACGCIFNKLSVNHDGVITPCSILPTTELGYIGRDKIPDIWARHPTLKALRERREIPMRDVPGCQTCEWGEFCNGSCPGLACEMTGDFNRGNPHDCYRRFLQQISESERHAMFISPGGGDARQ